MFCLALMNARMSESVWLSPVRGMDDAGLLGMLETTTSHTLLHLMLGLSAYLSKVLFHFQWPDLTQEAVGMNLPPPPFLHLLCAPATTILYRKIGRVRLWL